MANFEKFGHFLNALAMKKHTWPFCEIWPFFGYFLQFSHYNEIFNKYFVFFAFFGGTSYQYYSNTTVLQPCIVLKCVVMI